VSQLKLVLQIEDFLVMKGHEDGGYVLWKRGSFSRL